MPAGSARSFLVSAAASLSEPGQGETKVCISGEDTSPSFTLAAASSVPIQPRLHTQAADLSQGPVWATALSQTFQLSWLLLFVSNSPKARVTWEEACQSRKCRHKVGLQASQRGTFLV